MVMFKKKSKVIIVDDVLSKTVHNFLYNFTMREPIWNASIDSKEDHHKLFGRILYDDERNINTKTNVQALTTMVYMSILDRVDFLSDKIKRIHLGVKAPLQDDALHIDNLDDNCYSVLYYLNPEWKKKWGGQTIVDNEKIEYKPNRAIIYKSNTLHRGLAPKGPVFRSYINYVVYAK